ncbi:hypothetical protein D9758_019120 [Tetrapyrgos nigripes]|uniref:DUF4100 domain-containing protein n=1 Tax=Tetrapyrgos nigripes TaxID=182062 RepID=A0A8H5F074_9AGAR|nr:hypothetical protein D9758_019120 [Tetrapyrgos nigripes]
MHPKYCPETALLIRDNLIIQDAATNRYLLPNRDSLPCTPYGFNGGVAQYLRSLANVPQNSNTNNDGNSRDLPPHMAGSRNSHSMGLVFDHQDVLSDAFAVRSLGPTSYSSFQATHSDEDFPAYPTTCSQKTNNRFDPTKRPEELQLTSTLRPQESRGPRQNQPPQNNPHPSAQPNPAPVPARQPPQSPPKRDVNIPPLTNLINRQEGQQELKNKDVHMREAPTSTQLKDPAYHFTSTLSEQAELQKIYEYIMKHKILLSIGQILGSSPQLQKIFTENTCTKCEYNSKEAEYSVNFSSSPSFSSPMSSLHVGNPEQLADFLLHYSNAVVMDRGKFYSMSTGKKDVSIGGKTFMAMIDSGSELNLMSREILEMMGLPVNYEGTRWSLRGVHGHAEPLQGVVTDAPIMIGKHEFPHHIFIANNDLDKQDIILGQPFLHHFAARLDYGNRSGKAKLFLWADGLKKGLPSVGILITDPDDKRNTAKIDRCSHVSKIEDYSKVPYTEDF